jgi:hypothetical protein
MKAILEFNVCFSPREYLDTLGGDLGKVGLSAVLNFREAERNGVKVRLMPRGFYTVWTLCPPSSLAQLPGAGLSPSAS